MRRGSGDRAAPALSAAVDTPSRTGTVDHYLETIYCIAAEGEVVRPSRLADWLGVSAPTVSVGLQRLARDGWIDIATDRSITLTAEGEMAAAAIVRRHRVLERWLTDELGFDWTTADIEADRLASAMSENVLARLDASMNHPTTCPHGNPIPGRKAPYGDLIALADLEPGTAARVQRISEIAEHEARQLLRQLADFGVHTGTEVRVASSTASPGSLDVVVEGRTLTLSTATGRLLWVEVIQEAMG